MATIDHVNVSHLWKEDVTVEEMPVVGGSVQDELRALYAEGVDGVFADFPGTAVAVRDQMAAE